MLRHEGSNSAWCPKGVQRATPKLREGRMHECASATPTNGRPVLADSNASMPRGRQGPRKRAVAMQCNSQLPKATQSQVCCEEKSSTR